MNTDDPQRWRRRALSIPGMLALGALSVLALPLTLTLGVAVDLALGRPLPLLRLNLLLCFYAAMEIWGLYRLTLDWLDHRHQPGVCAERAHQVQHAWTLALHRAFCWLYKVRYRLENPEALDGTPFVLMLNHASTADTLLPMAVVVVPYDLRARFVLKRELLWDPCLDVAGQRMNNHFVRRGGGEDAAREVGRLGEDLGARDVVVIYPEGTRFTPSRRARRIEALAAEADDELATRARALKHTLLPRPGGTVALLGAAAGVDVVIAAHVGYGRIRGLHSLLRGDFFDQEVRVSFKRVPAEAIPVDPYDQERWLYDQWAMLDAWIAVQRTRPDRAAPT